MSKTIEAVYENGVFKPVSSVEIKDHAPEFSPDEA